MRPPIDIKNVPSLKSGMIRLVHIMTVPISLGFFRGQTGYMKKAGIEVHAISSPRQGARAFR